DLGVTVFGLVLALEQFPQRQHAHRLAEGGALVRRLRAEHFDKLPDYAAATLIVERWTAYATSVWPRRQATLLPEPREDPERRLYFDLCMTRAPMIAVRQLLTVLQSRPVEISADPAAASLHGRPRSTAPRPAPRLQRATSRQAARHHSAG